MAQRTILELVDDLDGGKADETVTFALDGVEFVIDLSADNAARLRDTLAEYVGHARRTGGRKQRGAVAHEVGRRHRATASRTRRRSASGPAARARRSPSAAACPRHW